MVQKSETKESQDVESRTATGDQDRACFCCGKESLLEGGEVFRQRCTIAGDHGDELHSVLLMKLSDFRGGFRERRKEYFRCFESCVPDFREKRGEG